MAGFKWRGNEFGLPATALEAIVINTSVTVKWGGLVRIVTSASPTANNGVVCEDVATGESIYGLCEGFINKDGVALEIADSSTYDGTFTDGILGTKSYAASADNLTDKMVKALVRPLTYADILENTPDATPGTTTGSYTRYNFTDTVDDVTVDESNASSDMTTVAQLIIWGRNPDNTSNVFYKVKELQDEAG